MKIVALEAENVKVLKAVEIHPNGSTVVIGGENGQGKSSVLDCISYALGGKDLVCEDPVRHGEKTARIKLDMGEIIVVRKFGVGESLKITRPDGATIASPQKFLDEVYGSLSFDPLEFSRMKPRDQAQTLRDLVGLDTSKIDERRKVAFDKRTNANREAAQLEAQKNAAPHFADAPAVEVSVSELSKSYTEAVESNNKRSALAKKIADNADRIKALKAEIERLETESHGADLEMAKIEFVEVAPIKAKIDSAESDNRKVRANATRAELVKRWNEKTSEAAALTTEIEKCDAEKTALLGAAKFPVDGLSVDGDVVKFNGIPYAQASSAEKLRVAVAMGIAMNPKLKVLLIRDASLLDEKSMAMIGEMATAADAQLWIERVGHGKECSIVMEGGEAHANQ